LRYEDAAPEYDRREQWAEPPPNLDLPVDERRVGRIGGHLISELVSAARYVREAGHNRLWLVLRR
jgi:hypothetical protein